VPREVPQVTRRLPLPLILVGLLLAFAGPVAAHGGPVSTFTDVVKDVTESFPEVNPCTGDPGTVTITYNGVFHVTEHPDGHYHVTGTTTGTFVFDTTDPTLPDLNGHFATWFGENSNPQTFAATFTFKAQARASDGSRVTISQTAHITLVGSEVIVEFDNLRCG
jgi:hypothetical protein